MDGAPEIDSPTATEGQASGQARVVPGQPAIRGLRRIPRGFASGRIPVVFTMGKVSSSSISTAIKRAGLPCHDVHSLNDEHLKLMARKFLDHGEFPPRHVCVSMAWKGSEIGVRTRCFYITLVREPVARNLSAFFQNLHEFSHGKTAVNDELASKTFEKFRGEYNHNVAGTWFDREFNGEVGIDVFNHKFEKSQKFAVNVRRNFAVFRIDAPTLVKQAVLSRVFGRRIHIQRTNDSSAKDYAELYNRVRRIARFDEAFLDKIYSTRFAKHFWTKRELDQFKAYWLGKADAQYDLSGVSED